MHVAMQLMILVFGGLSLGWLAVEKWHWPLIVAPLGAVLGLVGFIMLMVKQTMLMPTGQQKDLTPKNEAPGNRNEEL